MVLASAPPASGQIPPLLAYFFILSRTGASAASFPSVRDATSGVLKHALFLTEGGWLDVNVILSAVIGGVYSLGDGLTKGAADASKILKRTKPLFSRQGVSAGVLCRTWVTALGNGATTLLAAQNGWMRILIWFAIPENYAFWVAAPFAVGVCASSTIFNAQTQVDHTLKLQSYAAIKQRVTNNHGALVQLTTEEMKVLVECGPFEGIGFQSRYWAILLIAYGTNGSFSAYQSEGQFTSFGLSPYALGVLCSIAGLALISNVNLHYTAGYSSRADFRRLEFKRRHPDAYAALYPETAPQRSQAVRAVSHRLAYKILSKIGSGLITASFWLNPLNTPEGATKLLTTFCGIALHFLGQEAQKESECSFSSTLATYMILSFGILAAIPGTWINISLRRADAVNKVFDFIAEALALICCCAAEEARELTQQVWPARNSDVPAVWYIDDTSAEALARGLTSDPSARLEDGQGVVVQTNPLQPHQGGSELRPPVRSDSGSGSSGGRGSNSPSQLLNWAEVGDGPSSESTVLGQ